jgi:hypothetical protein
LVAGEPLDRALRMVPGLKVLDPSPTTWREAQAHLGDFIAQWSPQGLLGRMGEALLELRGTARIFGQPKDVAARILKDLMTRMGWMGHGGLSQSAATAQLAARLEKHLEHVADGFEATFLAPHPLIHLPDLQSRTEARLHRLGLDKVGDIQPLPVTVLSQLMPEPDARRLLSQARGEDRPRLPMLADPPWESRHLLQLTPPCLPEEVALAPWLLERLWNDGRSPRELRLRWWDVDGECHTWRAGSDPMSLPPLALARAVTSAFLRQCTRRILVRRLEVRMGLGLGRDRSLFEDPATTRLEALESSLARLRHRYPDCQVLPGWARQSERNC